MRARRTVPALVATAVAAFAVGGCSTPSGPTPTASATGPASRGPVASSQTASASTGTFAVLPESVLAPMTPLGYTDPAGADAGMVAQGANPAVSAVFSGGISREFTYQGTTVGGVELYRFDPSVPADSRARFVPLMVQSFAKVTPTATTLGTTPVQVADGARGTAVTAIGWTKGDDVVLVWAQGVPATQQIAQEYLAQSGG